MRKDPRMRRKTKPKIASLSLSPNRVTHADVPFSAFSDN